MATSLLESSALSVFCESIAVMLSAGIQTDEAVGMLGESSEDTLFKRTCDHVYAKLNDGESLASAMESTGAFPRYAIDMVAAGEQSGRLELVLRRLSMYFDEEARLFSKIRSSIGYPAALLCIMSVILAFTVFLILPTFINVYENLSGGLAAGSFSVVNLSIIIGWVALVVTLVCTVIALVGLAASRSQSGRVALTKVLERLPFSRQAMYQLALSRFTSAIATFTASGIDTNTAMRDALAMVEHVQLKAKLTAAYDSMISLDSAKSLAQAIYESDVYEPVYARMLMIGTRSGSLDHMFENLSEVFFEDAIDQIDDLIDGMEPTLAAFMTIAVGATLIAVMIPLIGVMGSIG